MAGGRRPGGRRRPDGIGAAAGAWVGRPAPVRIAVGDDGLAFEPDGPDGPYAAIDGLTAARRPTGDRFEMQVYYPGGAVGIPARLTVPSRDLYAFLASRLEPSGGRDVPSTLHGFRDDQEAKFGPDRVFTYRSRTRPPVKRGWRVGVPLFGAAGCLLAAAAGQSVGGDGEAYAVGGLVSAFMFGVFGVAFWAGNLAGRAEGHGDSGLVVGPTGIALAQGGLKGKMRWDEVRGIEYPPKARTATHTTAASKRGIGVVVAGAYIVIQDHYDRPPLLIYARMKAYWAGGGRPD